MPQTAHAATVAMKEQFDVPGYPTLVIVDAVTGAVCSKFVGEKTWSEKIEGVKLPLVMPHWQVRSFFCSVFRCFSALFLALFFSLTF